MTKRAELTEILGVMITDTGIMNNLPSMFSTGQGGVGVLGNDDS